MSKSLLLCSFLLAAAYAAGSEEKSPVDSTVERLRHAMDDTTPTKITHSTEADPTALPATESVQEKAFSEASSLVKTRGKMLMKGHAIDADRKKKAKKKKKKGHDDDHDDDLGLDHAGAGEAGHIHKKAFKEANKKVNNYLMRYCLKAANTAIRATFREVTTSQKVLNSLPNGAHCAYKNQHQIKHARELIKERKKELSSAALALRHSRRARVKFSATYESAACASFFSSASYYSAKQEVKKKRRLHIQAKANLVAARDNLKTQLKDAAAARHRCRCAVKAHAIKSHRIAIRRTPTRHKTILRELMVRCLVFGNIRSKCKKIRLSPAYKRRLGLRRTKLVRAAEKAKCGGVKLKKEKRTNEGKYTGASWCETFHSCLKGDGRNFWAWVKATDYERFKGACAESNGKYGNRHKYWSGKFTFKQCKAKCNAMGKRCQGITMPMTIRRIK